jgi:hypothetical protein
MDFIVQLPKTRNGYDSIVVFVDKLTKRAHFQPCHTSITAPEVATIFFSTIFRYHGLPKVIISDRDTKFTSKFWKCLFEHIGTKLAMSSSYHPQTDGQSERMNRTLEEMLRTYTNYRQNNWDELLPAVEFAYNNSKQASTGYTPFELDNGQHPETPSTMASLVLNVAASEEFLNHWNNTIKIAKDTLMTAQQRQTKYANQHRRDLEFKIGDKVLLNASHVKDPVDKERLSRKLTPKYLGPFEIIEQISHVAYKLKLPANIKIHPVVHISVLKPYQEDDEFVRPIPPQPEIIDDEVEYEVEQILDKKFVRRRPYYLVKWKGYPLHDSSWEPRENLTNCNQLLDKYELEH